MRPAGGGLVPRSRITNRLRKRQRVAVPAAACAGWRQVPESAEGHKVKPIDGADVQWPVLHWNIRLREQNRLGKSRGGATGLGEVEWRRIAGFGVVVYSHDRP